MKTIIKKSNAAKGKFIGLFIAFLLFFNCAKASPVAYFTSSPQTGCAPLLVHYYNASQTGSYSWNFGDPASGSGDTSSMCAPIHIYNLPGTYTITLTVINGSGTFTHTETVTVLASPNPSISGTAGICIGSSASYTVPYTSGNSYSWNVTGGIFTPNTNGNTINVNWTSTGTGTIILTETNAYGCKGYDTFTVNVAALPNIRLECKKGGDPKNTTCICGNSISNYYMPNDGSTYQWYVTNGTLLPPGANSNNANVQWGSSGTASITVVATNMYGCKDSATCIFELCPAPTAIFSAPNACLGNATSFTDASIVTGTITNWQWNFGDGNFATIQSPTHTYAAPGFYNVKLTVTNAGGCKDDTVMQVYVDPGNGPKIVCPGTVCAKTSATYSTLYIPGATYTWTVTGQTSYTTNTNGNEITVNWGNGPAGTITLVVTGTSFYTCSQPVTVNIPIFPTSPNIVGPLIVCPNSTTTYTAPLIPGATYGWNVSGGLIVSNNGYQIQVQWPASPAAGTVSVYMKNSLVCCEGGDTINIIGKPYLAIGGQQSVCVGSTHTYGLTGGINANWSVTNGNITSTFNNVNSITVNWPTSGSAMISATPVISGIYCNAVALYNVNVVDPPLPANFSGEQLVCLGSTQTYSLALDPTVSSTNITVSSGGTVSNPTTNSADITWNSPGSQTITVAMYNNTGCSTISTFSVYVVPATVPTINGVTTVCVNDIQTYTYNSSAPAAAYDWNVVGGTVLSGYGNDTLMVQWGYSSNGTVTLNNLVCGTSANINVSIYDTPQVYIDTTNLTCTGTSITLTALTAPGMTYIWSAPNASNGSTSASISATMPGTYSVTVTNPAGCSSTSSITLTTIPSLPTPPLGLNVTQLITPPALYPMWQIDAPTGPGYTYSWSTSETTPTIFVQNYGTYSVTYTNAFGCSQTVSTQIVQDTVIDTVCTGHFCPLIGNSQTITAPLGSNYYWNGVAGSQSITVNTNGTYQVIYTNTSSQQDTCTFTVAYMTATPSFTIPSPICNPVAFTNTSSPGSAIYLWEFGDGSYSNATNGTHTYTSTGTYTVVLNASADGVCWTSSSQTVTISTILDADFTPNIGCTPAVSFTNTSTIIGGTATYLWNFGDFTSSTSANPSHTYTNGGSYNVTLTISLNGCTSTITKTILVPQLDALFSSCGISCFGQNTQFVDMSIHTSPIISWYWNFGNGNTSTLQNPWNLYSTTGNYNISLTVTDINGCTSTQTINVNVNPINAGNITVTGDTTFCAGDSVILSAPSGYFYLWSNGATTQNITAYTTGNYSVTVMNSQGCTEKIGPVKVTSNPVPVATISLSGNDTLCSGSSVTLNAPTGPGFTYTWYNGTSQSWQTTSSITLSSIYDSGTYTVVVKNAFGCSDSSAPVTIIINESPQFYISGNLFFCKGGSTTLTVNNFSSATGISYVWSNASTATSITVSNPGIYSVTATAGNGCTYSMSVNVQYAPKTDFSLFPKGCYKICKGSAADVSAPNGSAYAWYNGNTLVSNNQILTITSPGTYSVIVTNFYGCTDTSHSFDVDTLPALHVTITAPNSILCKGSVEGIVLTANVPEGEGYTFVWSTGETTPTITVHDEGCYWVTVKINNCCYAKAEYCISSKNCCFPQGTPFTLIPDGYTVPADEVWDGKYFIAGKVHVTNNAILDLSEIDMVFDSTGEIIFHDNSIIRANNSVLRPCDMDSTWVGLTFLDKSFGLIHNCLFKNAQIAINVINKGDRTVKIVDNTFSQCHVSIFIDRGGQTYDEGITGNSFVIDNNPLPFATNDYFGIQLYNTHMLELISQNRFRNATKYKQQKNYYGIFSIQSSATVSENTFSNMHRSVDLLAPVKYFTIENNEIEMTESRTPNDYQIRVEKSQVPVVIYNNEFMNSLPNLGNTGTAAIYARRSKLLNIKENSIQGFAYGIQLESVTTSQVLENKIMNTQIYGIYYFDGVKNSPNNVDIACNEVRMDLMLNSTGLLPIGIATIDADNSTLIRTNCVFECANAIYTRSQYNERIPVIKNNYLYSYVVSGVLNAGHVGDIGNGTPFNQSGRNTFVRNHSPAVDIRSLSTTITQSGNYGINATVNVSSTGPKDKYSSTASCGLQMNYPKDGEIDFYAVCDHYAEKLYPFLQQGDVKDELLLTKDFSSHIKESPEMLLPVLQAIAANKTDLDKFYNEVISQNILIGNNKLWFDYNYNFMQKNYTKASGILNGISTQNEDEKDLKTLETIRLNLLLNNKNVKTLAENDKMNLKAIDGKQGTFAASARDMLQMNKDAHDYIFKQPEMPENFSTEMSKTIDVNSEFLEVYPNPASHILQVRYNIGSNEKINLRVTDILGKTVYNVPQNYTSTEILLDVTNLNCGAYIIYISNGETQKVAKFMKQ
ncbi:MAG: PKD domain-containing protein [Sphingobacteriales bacterium]|nr:MAG: PKD domain-containing protein [Sphingobacteriales bacterium]